VVPGDDGGGGEVDGLELPAPEALCGGCECLETFEKEVALEGEVAHFIAQEFLGDGLDDRIAATQSEETKIDFGDEFGREEHLDVELEVHEVAHPAEDGVSPLLLEQRATQMRDSARKQGGVALLLGDEEIDGTLIAAKIFQGGDAAGVAAQTRAAAAFAELEDGDGAGEGAANGLWKLAGSFGEFEIAIEARVGFEVVDPMLGVHDVWFSVVQAAWSMARRNSWTGVVRSSAAIWRRRCMTASTVSSSVEVPAVTPTLRASRNQAGSSSSGRSICSVRRPWERAFWAS
jgi:hypothetical protein